MLTFWRVIQQGLLIFDVYTLWPSHSVLFIQRDRREVALFIAMSFIYCHTVNPTLKTAIYDYPSVICRLMRLSWWFSHWMIELLNWVKTSKVASSLTWILVFLHEAFVSKGGVGSSLRPLCVAFLQKDFLYDGQLQRPQSSLRQVWSFYSTKSLAFYWLQWVTVSAQIQCGSGLHQDMKALRYT